MSFKTTLQRVFTTPYRPQPELRTFMERLQTQQGAGVEVAVAVLDARESEQLFGVPMARRGIQPVFVRVKNESDSPLRLQLVRIDANYYTPLEAAAANHFSMARRLYAFGFASWLILPLFLPLMLLLPLKLITAYLANGRMDDLFRGLSFHLRPIARHSTRDGFVYTSLDAGTKIVHVCLQPTSQLLDHLESGATMDKGIEFTFSVPVPGIAADYLKRDFDALVAPSSVVDYDLPGLVQQLTKMPAATCNAKATRSGDPVNLVVIGSFDTLLSAFVARWDESETITLATCWKTARSFLLGSQYRYSPVSPLHLFGRSQDVALQRTRRSINERLHLRLWLTAMRYEGRPVWVGQVSRDIGVRFTTRAWNLTTHRVDPDVDESRDFVIEDLLQAERLEAAGYVDGVGPCERAKPRRNLTGDPYFTDGRRAVILLAETRAAPRFVAWS